MVLSKDTLKQRIVERFGTCRAGDALAPGPAAWSDFDLNPWAVHLRASPDALREAAVLLPLIDREPEMTMLLTRRTEHLTSHAGQISLPGGRREEGDASPVATALRETQEEVGIKAEEVEILGAMETYETRTGFVITPVIGLVAPDFTLQPDMNEVEEVFEVPLDFLLDPGNHEKHSREFKGMTYHFHAMPYHDYYIWGATAAMLKTFYRQLME